MDSHPEQATAELKPGTRLGPYQIVSGIGAGGMGKVYKALDTRLDRAVAIKIALQAFGDRFEREARAIAALNHPHICTIHDIGNANGIPFIAMELLEGENLGRRIHGQPMPPSVALELAIQITAGLEAAHSKGIVHRDIKPANIFVTTDGQIKIMDFGLAKFASGVAQGSKAETLPLSEEALTATGTAVGTMAYMSPEQALGSALDPRSDIFSFGAVLFEMLTGIPPFRGVTLAAIADGVLHQGPPAVSVLAPDVPVAWDRIVAKALEKNRDLRYQRIADLRADLKQLEIDPFARTLPAIHVQSSRRRVWAMIATSALAMAGAIGLRTGGLKWPVRRPATAKIRAIAVLPLASISGEDYFADGMTDELIAALAKIRGWRVISRTSVMQYKNGRTPVPIIGKELGVDALVEGTVQQVQNRVRITVKLVRADQEEENLWTQSYDRDVRDVLDLQADVARSIADQIQLTLTPQERQRLAERHRVDPEVLQTYLRGKAATDRGTEDAILKGIAYFEQALQKDPAYAPAHAAMALAYGSLNPSYRSPKESMPKSREHAVRAIELDDSLSEAHTALADVMLRYDWDWAGAERESRRAIELNPNSAFAHDMYGNYLDAVEEHAKAIAEHLLAHEVDPFALGIYGDLLNSLTVSRDYPRAIAECRRAIQKHPDFSIAHEYLGMAYLLSGKFPEAVQAAQRAQKLDPSSVTANHFLAMAYAAAGNRREAEDLVAKLEKAARTRYTCAYEVASVHLRLGNREKAMEWLNRGVAEQCDCMIWLKTEPWIDPLRTDPRYAELVRRVGFPDH